MNKIEENAKNKLGYCIKRQDFLAHIPFKYIYIKIGETGYWEASGANNLPDEIIESAIAGSMFGWDCPAAQKAIEYAKDYYNE